MRSKNNFRLGMTFKQGAKIFPFQHNFKRRFALMVKQMKTVCSIVNIIYIGMETVICQMTEGSATNCALFKGLFAIQHKV